VRRGTGGGGGNSQHVTSMDKVIRTIWTVNSFLSQLQSCTELGIIDA
jgi:hypothetical protein